jgi:hypothetical protein
VEIKMASPTTDKPTTPADKTKQAADGTTHNDAIVKAGAALAQPESKITPSGASTAVIDGEKPPVITDAQSAKTEPTGIVDKAVKYFKNLFGSGSADIASVDTASLDNALLAKWSSDSTEDRDMRAHIARREQTSPEALKTLSEDTDAGVRAAVAGNIKTPDKILSALAKDKDESVVRAVLANPSSPKATKDRIVSKMTAGFGTSEKATAAAEDPNTPPEVLASLSSLRERETRHAVAVNPSTPEATLNQLAKDGDYWVRGGVASNNATPPETLRAMSTDKDNVVQDSLAQNSSTPIDLLQKMAGGADNLSYSSDSRDQNRYRKEDAARTMRNMAEDPKTTPAQLSQLAMNREPLTLNRLAKNPNTPADGLAKVVETSQGFYYGDKGDSIRQAVAENANASTQTLMKLAGDSGYFVQQAALDHISKIAEDPAVTQDTLNELGQSKDAQVLGRVARSKSASPELLTKLSDTFTNVRAAVAENPSTPPELLEKLSTDTSPTTREGVARNSASTPEMRAKLAEDPEESVRSALAGNKVTEPALLAKLATDKSDCGVQSINFSRDVSDSSSRQRKSS